MIPIFTVIVPVYNAADTIAETVRTILLQTERRFELLLIDDGSTDGSVAAMLRLASDDDRIRVLSHPNEGVSATRNLGAQLARGRYLAFCDADDCWHPTKLARHLELHETDPTVSVSFAGIAFLEPDQPAFVHAKTLSTVPAGDLDLATLVSENPVCTASNLVVTKACFRRVEGFNITMGFAEDQEWLARAAADGERIRGIDAILVDYRMSPAGLSSNLDRMYNAWRRLAATYRGLIDARATEAIYCRYLARRALRNGAPPRFAIDYALKGLRSDRHAFFDDAHRGALTLAGAFASPFIPKILRTRLFA